MSEATMANQTLPVSIETSATLVWGMRLLT
jgi:hypothetical protein